jgi:DNA-binding XRE family transcriptional regulator
MTPEEKARLEQAGWKVGTVAEFLGLTPEEEIFIEIQLALTKRLKSCRLEHGITQRAVAKKLGSSQPRVAALERGDPKASLDLLVRALLAAGASQAEIGQIISSATPPSGRDQGARPDLKMEEAAA